MFVLVLGYSFTVSWLGWLFFRMNSTFLSLVSWMWECNFTRIKTSRYSLELFVGWSTLNVVSLLLRRHYRLWSGFAHVKKNFSKIESIQSYDALPPHHRLKKSSFVFVWWMHKRRKRLNCSHSNKNFLIQRQVLIVWKRVDLRNLIAMALDQIT